MRSEPGTTGRKELDPLGADVTNPPPAPAEYLTDVPSLNPKWEQFWPLEAYSGRSPELQWEYDHARRWLKWVPGKSHTIRAGW
ncbi:MAG: hypothetical protein ACJ74W_07625 [Pyrinomonadaceae bacterium]